MICFEQSFSLNLLVLATTNQPHMSTLQDTQKEDTTALNVSHPVSAVQRADLPALSPHLVESHLPNSISQVAEYLSKPVAVASFNWTTSMATGLILNGALVGTDS